MVKQVVRLSFETNRKPLSEFNAFREAKVDGIDGIATNSGVAAHVAIGRAEESGGIIVIVDPTNGTLGRRRARVVVHQTTIGQRWIGACTDGVHSGSGISQKWTAS